MDDINMCGAQGEPGPKATLSGTASARSNGALPVAECDWEEIKPIFKQLYLVEDCTLKEVVAVLKTALAFSAPVHVYKAKITKWGFEKNYKASDKEQLAQDFKRYREQGGLEPMKLIHKGQPARFDRVRRHFRVEGIHTDICDILPTKARLHQNAECPPSSPEARNGQILLSIGMTKRGRRPHQVVASGGQSSRALIEPERPFPATSRAGRVEIVLLQIKTYYDFLYSNNPGGPPEDDPTHNAARITLSRIHDKFTNATASFKHQNNMRAFRLTNEACGMVQGLFAEGLWESVMVILQVLGDRDWTNAPGVRLQILRYMYKLSAFKLNAQHPLSVALFHFLDQEVLTNAMQPVSKLLLDFLEEKLGQHHPITASHRQRFWWMLYYHLEEYRNAESEIDRSIAKFEAEASRESSSDDIREALLYKGKILYASGRTAESERLFWDVIDRSSSDGELPTVDNLTWNARVELALTHLQQGEVAIYATYVAGYLERRVVQRGAEDEVTVAKAVDWKKMLQLFGKTWAQWVAEQFGSDNPLFDTMMELGRKADEEDFGVDDRPDHPV